jgi:hypothetical protein
VPPPLAEELYGEGDRAHVGDQDHCRQDPDNQPTVSALERLVRERLLVVRIVRGPLVRYGNEPGWGSVAGSVAQFGTPRPLARS